VPRVGGEAGKQVGIGGRRSLFVHCVGSGSPTVVLEAGFAANTFAWRDVQPPLGRATRVCAYDRAGTGNSVAPPGVRDARNEVADLRRLLGHARIDPPYVLVGHSYGGVVARVFARLWPAHTAGLVLIDTMGRDGRRRQLAIWPKSQAPELRRELATSQIGGVDLAAGEALASRTGTLGDTPLAVVTAGREDNFPRTPPQLAGALRRLWGRMQDELAGLSDNSVHVVALHSNHDVPASRGGQPSVVVKAVEAVVRAAREGTRLPPCSRIFSGSQVRCRN
jgi:pimeloyl-ACP methyl ester carboxylesterase